MCFCVFPIAMLACLLYFFPVNAPQQCDTSQDVEDPAISLVKHLISAPYSLLYFLSKKLGKTRGHILKTGQIATELLKL